MEFRPVPEPIYVPLGDGDAFSVLFSFEASLTAAELGDAPYDARVRATFAPELQDWVVTEFAALMVAGGTEVSTVNLRLMPVATALRVAVAAAPKLIVDRADRDWRETHVEFYERLRARRTSGPDDANLRDLVTVARVARLRRQPIGAEVAEAFGLPSRTATHWLKLARERGTLFLPLEVALEGVRSNG